LKKVYLEKVICQKLVQVSSREEYKLQFCTLLLPVTFLFSRAIAERLKTVISKITNVGQKGYNSSKYCQEVLISIIDEIQTAKITKKNGALLSLDIKKAFNNFTSIH
jgi:hypothetical protein